MTTSTDMFLETVSLNDDAASTGGHVNSSAADVDSLEAQRNSFPHVVKFAKNGASSANPISETDGEEDEDVHENGAAQREQVVVVVDSSSKAEQQRNGTSNGRPVLPPLRVPRQDEEDVYFRDYVDPTLFSPEVSRRAVEIARGRAKTLEMELKELALLEGESTPPVTAVKLSPAEAVGIISSAFVSSISKVKHLVTKGEKEYDLLSGSSPSSKIDDLDTDGDGLQISPDSSKGEGKHFQSKHRPVLKRVSAYSSLDKKVSNSQKQTKRIMWHEEVLDQDEEFYEEEALSPSSGETESLMDVAGANGQPQTVLHYKNDRLTPRSKKKRKKLVKGMMRRLTPSEKEELYKQRPDLMIIPNWAQKYRQGLEDEESSRWSFWLISIIGTLAVLLIVLIILIARERAAEASVKN
ncbi:hypothetical protein Gpo141_00004564 [Globisporangium polare]